MGEVDVYPKRLRQALMRHKFLAVVQCQGVPQRCGYWLEGANGGLVQARRRLVRHYFCQKHFGVPVYKRSYRVIFFGAFYGVSFLIADTGLLLNDFRAFVDGNTVRYLAVAVFCDFVCSIYNPLRFARGLSRRLNKEEF